MTIFAIKCLGSFRTNPGGASRTGIGKLGEKINGSRVRILALLVFSSIVPQAWSQAPAPQSTAVPATQEFKKPDPAVAPVTDKSNKPAPFTMHERFRFYESTTFSPFAALGPLTGSALSEWTTGNPPEWGQGFPGYGRRLLSGYSRQIISNSIAFGVALAAREDPRHYPTGEYSVWKRGLYAARDSFVSHNASGGFMPAYSRIIGVYGAGFISNAWYPAPYSNVHSALFRGSTALVSNIAWQEVKEFLPDIQRKFGFMHSGR